MYFIRKITWLRKKLSACHRLHMFGRLLSRRGTKATEGEWETVAFCLSGADRGGLSWRGVRDCSFISTEVGSGEACLLSCYCLAPPRQLKCDKSGRRLYERAGASRYKSRSCVVSTKRTSVIRFMILSQEWPIYILAYIRHPSFLWCHFDP